MRILHTVEYYEPSKGGAQEVIKQLSERLAQRGHAVTVATSYHPQRQFDELNGVRIRSFDVKGNSVKGISGDKDRYQTFLRESDYDVIMNYAAQTWTTDLMFPLLDNINAKKIIAPLGYSRLHHPRYKKYFTHLPRYLAKYDKIIYTSENYQDKYFGDTHGLSHLAVIIPNGASLEEFSSAEGTFREKYGIQTRYLFLNVSNHYFAKGHLFVLNAFRRLCSEDCTLVIIGERPSRHTWFSCAPLCRSYSMLDKRVRLLENVPREDVVSAYIDADLFLFGSKVECAPLVMYEAFASRTPFVTTDVGNVKDHGDIVSIIKRPGEMADTVRQLLANHELIKSKSRRAYEAFLEKHSWERVSSCYEELCLSLTAQRVIS